MSVLKRNRSTAGNVQSHFRKMADEKTAKGKPFPKEEVDFVLIGAGWWVDRTSTTVSFVLSSVLISGKLIIDSSMQCLKLIVDLRIAKDGDNVGLFS